MLLDLITCPEPTCRAVAEVLDRVMLPSTSGAVEHVKTFCVRRHFFLLPADRLWLTGGTLAVPRW